MQDSHTLVLATFDIHLRRSLLDFDDFGMKSLPVGTDKQVATYFAVAAGQQSAAMQSGAA